MRGERARDVAGDEARAGHAVQRRRGGGVGHRAGVRLDADHLGRAGARERERDPAHAAVGVDDPLARARPPARARSPRTPAPRRRGWPGRTRRADSRSRTRPPPSTSTRSSIVAAPSSMRSSPASAAKIALPRPRLTCSTTPITSGRAARNARASAGPSASGRVVDPGREHAAVVARAQHDVAQVAGQRALVVRGRRPPGRAAPPARSRCRRAAARRRGSPRCRRRRAIAARTRPAPACPSAAARRHQLRSVAVAERPRRRDAGRDRHVQRRPARARRAPASRRAALRRRGAAARSRRTRRTRRHAGGRRAGDGVSIVVQPRPRLGRVRRDVLDHGGDALARAARPRRGRAARSSAPSRRRRRRRGRRR